MSSRKRNLHHVPREISQSERRLHCRNLFLVGNEKWGTVEPDLTFPVTEWDLGTRLDVSHNRARGLIFEFKMAEARLELVESTWMFIQ